MCPGCEKKKQNQNHSQVCLYREHQTYEDQPMVRTYELKVWHPFWIITNLRSNTKHHIVYWISLYWKKKFIWLFLIKIFIEITRLTPGLWKEIARSISDIKNVNEIRNIWPFFRPFNLQPSIELTKQKLMSFVPKKVLETNISFQF